MCPVQTVTHVSGGTSISCDPNESDKLSVLPVHCEKTACTSYDCFETCHQNEFFSTATFPSSTVRMRSMPGTVSVCRVPLGQ